MSQIDILYHVNERALNSSSLHPDIKYQYPDIIGAYLTNFENIKNYLWDMLNNFCFQ